MEDEQVPISEARANLSELVASVRLLRRCVLLTQRGKPRAAVVPAELGEAIIAAGGPDAALRKLTVS
jgi:prevent-host-death family protein